MRAERRPYNFDTRHEFPDARPFRAWEGGCAYKAERDGKPFIIIDGRTMADFVDEADLPDREALNGLVSVIEFDSEAERNAHIAQKMVFGTDVENHRSSHTDGPD